MDNLYFTLASLPNLEPNGEPPFADMDSFWTYVSHVPGEWRAAFTSPDAPDPTVRAYRSFDLDFRTALARLRLEGLSWKEQAANLPSGGSEWTQRALEILEVSPLEGEFELDALRWSFLDDLSQGHEFDRVAFFAYALKLELVQRRSRLVRERGEAALNTLHTAVLARTNLNISMGEPS